MLEIIKGERLNGIQDGKMRGGLKLEEEKLKWEDEMRGSCRRGGGKEDDRRRRNAKFGHLKGKKRDENGECRRDSGGT